MKHASNLALAALAVAGLSACGNDADKLATASMIRGAGAQLVGGVLPGKKPAKPSPEQVAQAQAQMAAAALRSLKGPVIMATIESMGGTSVLGMISENNGVRTYATPGEQQMMLRQGMIAGTRGLGRDLMSADTASSAAAVTRGGGSATRVQRYLDGEWRERALTLTCNVATEGPFSMAGVSGRKVVERCTGGGTQIENSYLVNGGQILASRQWLGPQLGYAAIQVLRP